MTSAASNINWGHHGLKVETDLVVPLPCLLERLANYEEPHFAQYRTRL